jgi:Transcriptional regulatory protein, C terminal
LRYKFEKYSLDIDRRELWCGTDLVTLAPQVFDLLEYLVRNHDRIVAKDNLIADVWDGRVVSDSTLSSRITAVRHAIGDRVVRLHLLGGLLWRSPLISPGIIASPSLTGTGGNGLGHAFNATRVVRSFQRFWPNYRTAQGLVPSGKAIGRGAGLCSSRHLTQGG